jgi:hypothetical protein
MSKKRRIETKPEVMPPAPGNEYSGKFGVHCYHGGVPAFLIVRLGADINCFTTTYEPLLALDKDSGEVLMRYRWDLVQEEDADEPETWSDGGVVAHQLLEVFDDFETAYFYAQGLTRRAA